MPGGRTPVLQRRPSLCDRLRRFFPYGTRQV